jgi:hypothetical protein
MMSMISERKWSSTKIVRERSNSAPATIHSSSRLGRQNWVVSTNSFDSSGLLLLLRS